MDIVIFKITDTKGQLTFKRKKYTSKVNSIQKFKSLLGTESIKNSLELNSANILILETHKSLPSHLPSHFKQIPQTDHQELDNPNIIIPSISYLSTENFRNLKHKTPNSDCCNKTSYENCFSPRNVIK